jgi:hypothetical protein
MERFGLLDSDLGIPLNITDNQRLFELRVSDLESQGSSQEVDRLLFEFFTEELGLDYRPAEAESIRTFDRSVNLLEESSSTNPNVTASTENGIPSVFDFSGARTSNEVNNALQQASSFDVIYQNVYGASETYSFSLLPAIESNLRPSVAGASVPEVKPGILLRTSMNHKKFSVPGAPPVIQTLGVDQTILQIVGLFLGVEGNSFTRDTTNYFSGQNQSPVDAEKAAITFDQEIVQGGRPIQILIAADGATPDGIIQLEFNCLIQNFRYFMTRSDRCYYAIDAIMTEYRRHKLPASLIGTEFEDVSTESREERKRRAEAEAEAKAKEEAQNN